MTMTKLQLLEKVSEEEIVKFYLPEFQPGAGKNYKSPFGAKDDKPSLSFYKGKKGINFKSHNTGHQGDVFQFVADIKNIDCKANFASLIDSIAQDFSLNGFAEKEIPKQTISFEKAPSVTMLKYFEQFKIDLETLIKFNVQQVKFHSFISKSGKLCKFDYRKLNKLAICYTVNSRIKLYFPKIEGIQEKTFGFKNQNTSDIFGFTQLDKCENLFITAGEKDCLALNANGLTGVSFQSENTMPSAKQIDILRSKAKNIFLIYDNDEAGKSASEKICKTFSLTNISLPVGIKDVAEFFKIYDSANFEDLISLEKFWVEKKSVTKDISKAPDEEHEEEAWTIFHQAEKYLSQHYDIRFNSISLEHEISVKNENKFSGLNENDLFVEINKRGIKLGMDKLIAILKSNYVAKYNPFKNYFANLPAWDEKRDYIGELASYLHCDEAEELLEQFTKWIIRVVKCSLEEGYYNKQAFILVHSKQNSGKTTFCRFLCPPALRDYQAENISDDKDSKIAIAKNFLINLDELSSLAKHEINSLKSLFSKDIINERLPYDRKNSIIHRVASFLGSTNLAEFLTDETGSVRWLCFEIKKIDWNYKQNIDINKVWAQAFDLYKDGFECEMNVDDISKNEIRNSKFQQLSQEAEMIPNFLLTAEEKDGRATFCSSTDILIYLSSFTSIRLNKVAIGRAMPVCGFKRVKNSLIDRYGYWVIKLK